MPQIRHLQESEAERVRDLWLQMCMEVGTPLPATSSSLILNNLRQYATHQMAHCFIAEEQSTLIGFVTCVVTGHPVIPGLSGEIEELYVQLTPHQQEAQANLVRHAVKFMQTQGAKSIHTRICVGKECPEEKERRAFWQTLQWENDMTIYSIYGDIPEDPSLQSVWDAYKE